MNTIKRLPLFPKSAAVRQGAGHSELTIAGLSLVDLARRHGTPLYLYDRSTLDDAVADYRSALRQYPADTGITYAGKAGLCTALAQWADASGLWIDCTGAGEVHVALRAGVPRERILVHGVNKSEEDLALAVSDAGVIVVDNLPELSKLIARRDGVAGPFPELWLRIRPGVAVETHAYRQTGQEDSKFGMGLTEAIEALGRCAAHGVRPAGIHFHQGSHFHGTDRLGAGIDAALDFVGSLQARTGWLPRAICPGGGWGVAYHEAELPHPPVATYVAFIAHRLVEGCRLRDLPLPSLHVEPGRSLVARAGVALYRVGAVKATTTRRWVLLDGGMADNIRPALYGASYSALPVVDPGRRPEGASWLAGPYCESSDVLVSDLPFPDVSEGELVAVPMSGAYHIAMSSNYNGARRPPVVWLEDGQAHLIQRRETIEDLVARDLPLPNVE